MHTHTHTHTHTLLWVLPWQTECRLRATLAECLYSEWPRLWVFILFPQVSARREGHAHGGTYPLQGRGGLWWNGDHQSLPVQTRPRPSVKGRCRLCGEGCWILSPRLPASFGIPLLRCWHLPSEMSTLLVQCPWIWVTVTCWLGTHPEIFFSQISLPTLKGPLGENLV